MRTAFFLRVACAMTVCFIVVAWAAFLIRVADAERVGSVVIAWAALVAVVALAVFWVSSPGVEEGVVFAAFSQRIARTELIVEVIVTQVRAALDVTYARAVLVVSPYLSWAAETIILSRGAVHIDASGLVWATVQ
jgi:hypothetical protein